MEHVRLPLLQKEYFLKKVLKERLVTLSLECKFFFKIIIIVNLSYHNHYI